MVDRALIAKKLGRYDIIRVLGKGAMGVVYEARDPNLNRKVAIKTVRLDSLSKQEAADYELRFRTEAHSAARLQHPNIVSVYDHDRDGSTPFLVMEFVKGEDLKHYLDAGQRYTLEQSVRMVRDLLAALDYAHQNKIVHRDIKPANLLIEADGRVKLTDFGVARIQDSGEATRTQGGMVGTLKYMSPEQVEGKIVDASSDMFSAGIVLYQLLTDRRPFDGDSYFSIVNQITNQHPPAPSSINRMLTSAIDAVVARALAKDKKQRFATAQDFSSALQAAARRTDPTITPSANPYKIIEQQGTGAHERSGSSATTHSSSLSNSGSTITQELELVYWKDVKESDDAPDLEGFLSRFPEGVYADLAKRRLKRIADARAAAGQSLYENTLIAPPLPATQAVGTDAAKDTALAVSSDLNDDTQPLQRAETGQGQGQAQTISQAQANETGRWPAPEEHSVLAALDDALAEAASAAPAPAPTPAKPPQRKQSGLWLCLGAAIVGLAVFGLWKSQQSRVITELASEAGKPVLATSAATATAGTPTASITATTATAANTSRPTITHTALAAPVPVASEPNTLTQTSTAALSASKSTEAAARASISARLQAPRDASARPVAGSTGGSAGSQIASAPKPAEYAPAAVAAPVAPRPATAQTRAKDNAAGPKEACEGRSFFGYGSCLYEQCAKPAFTSHPYCVEQRERQEKGRNSN